MFAVARVAAEPLQKVLPLLLCKCRSAGGNPRAFYGSGIPPSVDTGNGTCLGSYDTLAEGGIPGSGAANHGARMELRRRRI
uniref:Uncharacterized protein n=1 Tax=Knipowitschia caucasica TaxID=637954 RepID=A0AAV2KSM5_KNICA